MTLLHTTTLLEEATLALANRDENSLIDLRDRVSDCLLNADATRAYKALLWTMAIAAGEMPEGPPLSDPPREFTEHPEDATEIVRFGDYTFLRYDRDGGKPTLADVDKMITTIGDHYGDTEMALAELLDGTTVRTTFADYRRGGRVDA